MTYMYGFDHKLPREPLGPSAKVDLKQFFQIVKWKLPNDVQIDGGLKIAARSIPVCEKDSEIYEDPHFIEPESDEEEEADMVQNGEAVEAVQDGDEEDEDAPPPSRCRLRDSDASRATARPPDIPEDVAANAANREAADQARPARVAARQARRDALGM